MRSLELKSGLIVTLLVMILLRLVWMDLRSYVITYAPQNRFAFDRSEVSDKCRRSLSLRQIGPDRPVQGSWERPSWADAWIYEGLVLASCRHGVFQDTGFVRYNQGLLIASCMFCVLLTRIIGRSWIVGLIVAVALLSRGRLISANGQIAADTLIVLGLSSWAMLVSHWFRSGSRWIFFASYLVVAVLVTLEPSFALIGLAPVFVLYMWRPLIERHRSQVNRFATSGNVQPKVFRLESRDLRLWHRWGKLLNLSLGSKIDEGLQGSFFRPLPLGLRSLVGKTDFFKAMQPIILLSFAIIFAVFVGQSLLGKYTFPTMIRSPGPVWQIWLTEFFRPLDRDLGMSIGMMLLALTWRSRWLPSLRPLVNTIGLAVFLSAMGCLTLDLVYLPIEAERLWQASRLLLLWEPVLMTLGMLAFYQMLLSILARLDLIKKSSVTPNESK